MTEFRELDVARWFWAMAQMAPLSLAEATFLPVLIRVWVVMQVGVGRVEVLQRDHRADIGVDASSP